MTLSPNDPRHGQHAGSVAGCRETCCRLARRRYDKQLAMRKMHGLPTYVDPTAATEHVEALVAAGMQRSDIAAASGVAIETVTRIQRQDVILASTEAALLAVTAQPGVNCWPALPAIRRLRALVALGHPCTALGEWVQMGPTQLSMMLNDTRGWETVTPEVWARIADAYDQMSMTPGTSRRSLTKAASRGWVPPLAWDDIDTDPAPTGVRESDELTRRRVTRADLDQHACPRCGVMRQARTSDALCIDCRVVEDVAS